LENPAGQTNVLLRFRLVGADTPEPARLRVVRNRQLSPPATGFELYTGDGELPCRLLAMGMSELRSLGPRCRFRGYVWADETTDGWEGELTGQLVELDLGSLVSDHFPHRLSGIGRATVQSARFHHGRLEEGNATLVAGPGAIDRSLVVAAMDCLGLAPGAEPIPVGEQIAYRQLAVTATLDAGGLRLHGQCAAGGPGTILSDGRVALLAESPRRLHPVSALVQSLVPASALQVPASRQTDWLLRHLPVPDAIPSPASIALPTAHLRLRDTWR